MCRTQHRVENRVVEAKARGGQAGGAGGVKTGWLRCRHGAVWGGVGGLGRSCVRRCEVAGRQGLSFVGGVLTPEKRAPVRVSQLYIYLLNREVHPEGASCADIRINMYNPRC